jgi:hypothetical protein
MRGINMNNPNKRPSGRRPLTPLPTPHSPLPIFLFSFFIFLLFASCSVEPGPLYGTWADNKGNTLSFFDDNTFNARIANAGGSASLNYSGNYSLLLNSLTMNCTDIDLRVVTEWDIRGNILYLNWVTPDGDTLPLTLFKVSN